jgi:hypothetical protein
MEKRSERDMDLSKVCRNIVKSLKENHLSPYETAKKGIDEKYEMRVQGDFDDLRIRIRRKR